MSRKYVESYVCDRCGKEFVDTALDQANWFKPTFLYMNALMFIRKNERLLSREQIPYDFCKECAESFMDWFHEGKET